MEDSFQNVLPTIDEVAKSHRFATLHAQLKAISPPHPFPSDSQLTLSIKYRVVYKQRFPIIALPLTSCPAHQSPRSILQQIMAEDFQAVIIGICELMQAKATISGEGPASSLSTKIPSESLTLGGSGSNTSNGIEPDTGDVRRANTSSNPLNDLQEQSTAPADLIEKDAFFGREEGKVSGTGVGGETCCVSQWLVNAHTFVSKVLDWAKEGIAKRQRSCGRGYVPKPPKRSMLQC